MNNTAPIRKFHVVPFSSTDYSLGHVLLENDGTVSTDPVAISAKLSLLFQWSEYSWVGAFIPGREEPLPCTLSYDEDEATPSELRLTFSTKMNMKSFSFIKKSKIRFEVFRICYEFETTVLAIADQNDTTWDIIIAIPERLVTYKQRRLPRVRVQKELNRTLPEVYCEYEDGTRSLPLSVIEMGLNSVVTKDLNKLSQAPKNLVFGKTSPLRIPVESFRKQDRHIFRLIINDNTTFGKYFDIYRFVAYPGLVPRNSIPAQNLLQLYEETGYMEGFPTRSEQGEQNLREELLNTWALVNGATPDSTADYVILDSEARTAGASSVTRAFADDKQEYWAFHQLCSRKSPDLLTASGHLYAWRAEYLAGRIGPLKGIAWYRSDSRWLERIYTKFSRQSNGNSTLTAVKLVKGKVSPLQQSAAPSLSLKICETTVGEAKRHFTRVDCVLSGLGPNRLNASGLLNHVLSPDEDMSPSALINIAAELVRSANCNSAEFYLSLPVAAETPDGNWKVTPSDRLCIFTKDDLLNFLTCVEHSIAVTRRKMEV